MRSVEWFKDGFKAETLHAPEKLSTGNPFAESYSTKHAQHKRDRFIRRDGQPAKHVPTYECSPFFILPIANFALDARFCAQL